MQIPQGFQFDANTGLYFREDPGVDKISGAPQRAVTWFDPNNGSYRTVLYPLETAQPQVVVNMQEESQQPEKKKKTGCIVAIVLFLVLGFLGLVVGVLLVLGVVTAGTIGFLPEDVDEEVVSVQEAVVNTLPSAAELDDIHILVDAESEQFANEIIIQNMPFDNEYAASLPGAARGDVIYSWDLYLDDFQLRLYHSSTGGEGSVRPQDMRASLMVEDDNGGVHLIEDVNFEIIEDNIVFYDVDFSYNSTFALTQISGYAFRIQYGERETQGTPDMDMRVSALEETESDDAPQESSNLGSYSYELVGPGLFANLQFDVPSPGLVMMELDFGGSTYTLEAAYTMQGDTVEIVLDGGLEEIGWSGYSQLTRTEGGLTLTSGGPLGVVEEGETLVSQGGAESAGAISTATYVCMDEDMIDEYRPYIEFHGDGTFYMFINMGEGVYGSSGTYTVDEAARGVTLTFLEINGTSPGANYSTAQLEIVNDNTLYFVTEGFGLMGYGETQGLFTRV